MRSNVTFRHPAEFVSTESAGGGVLDVRGASWFSALLRRVPHLAVDADLCQEDWGVVFFVKRNGKKFWIGLSAWDTSGAWLAHIHHGSFAWLQQFNSSARNELKSLLIDLHNVLVGEPEIADIAWYEPSEINKRQPAGFTQPIEG